MEVVKLSSYFPQWAQDLNTGLSFIGFLITLYVLLEVKSIKNSFLRRARLPEVVKELSKVGSTLSSNLGQWPSQRNEVHCQIKVAASLLKSATKLLPKEEKKEVLQTQKKLKNAADDFNQPRFMQVDAVWDLYSDIQSAITSMNQLSKNIKWE
jgi:hypothetical protein